MRLTITPVRSVTLTPIALNHKNDILYRINTSDDSLKKKDKNLSAIKMIFFTE